MVPEGRQEAGLTLGPIVGAVTDTTAKIWVRTHAPAEEFRVECKAGEEEAAVSSSTINTAEDSNNTGVVLVGGLRPNTR